MQFGLPLDRLLEARSILTVQVEDADRSALNAERAKEALAADHASHVQHLRETLARVERAIAKVHDGSYGRCDRCSVPIPPDQLERAPETVHCADCA